MEELRRRLTEAEDHLKGLSERLNHMDDKLNTFRDHIIDNLHKQDIELKDQSKDIKQILQTQHNAGKILFAIFTPVLGLIGLGTVLFLGLLILHQIKI